jgi:hypothetical protein
MYTTKFFMVHLRDFKSSSSNNDKSYNITTNNRRGRGYERSSHSNVKLNKAKDLHEEQCYWRQLVEIKREAIFCQLVRLLWKPAVAIMMTQRIHVGRDWEGVRVAYAGGEIYV